MQETLGRIRTEELALKNNLQCVEVVFVLYVTCLVWCWCGVSMVWCWCGVVLLCQCGVVLFVVLRQCGISVVSV